jgi:hypothetical protein
LEISLILAGNKANQESWKSPICNPTCVFCVVYCCSQLENSRFERHVHSVSSTWELMRALDVCIFASCL